LAGQRGRPVVVNFWASWCVPCRAEAPLLQRAYRRYGKSVAFIGVNAQDATPDARKFLRQYGVSYPNLVDATGQIGTVVGVTGLPTTLIVDRNGRTTSTVVGGIGGDRLASSLQDALRR